MELEAPPCLYCRRLLSGCFFCPLWLVVDLGIILANDFPLVGNSRVGGLEAIASVQFDQREVGAFGRTPVQYRTPLQDRTPLRMEGQDPG
jgi:hypothetical protein